MQRKEEESRVLLFREFREKLRIILARTPADEYPRILQEAEDLAQAIENHPQLYEPIHCPHGHGTERRIDGNPAQVAESRAVVALMAERSGLRAEK